MTSPVRTGQSGPGFQAGRAAKGSPAFPSPGLRLHPRSGHRAGRGGVSGPPRPPVQRPSQALPRPSHTERGLGAWGGGAGVMGFRPQASSAAWSSSSKKTSPMLSSPPPPPPTTSGRGTLSRPKLTVGGGVHGGVLGGVVHLVQEAVDGTISPAPTDAPARVPGPCGRVSAPRAPAAAAAAAKSARIEAARTARARGTAPTCHSTAQPNKEPGPGPPTYPVRQSPPNAPDAQPRHFLETPPPSPSKSPLSEPIVGRLQPPLAGRFHASAPHTTRVTENSKSRFFCVGDPAEFVGIRGQRE